MARTSLVVALVGSALVAGALARGGEEAPAAAQKIELGRDLREFPEGNYEIVQSMDTRTHKQSVGHPPQTTGSRFTFTFDMKFRPPGKALGDEGEITIVVRRVQVEMEVGEKVVYDSAARPELRVEVTPAPPDAGKAEAAARERQAQLALQSGRTIAKQFRTLLGRSARAAVRVSLLPNRSQVEAFEGLDAAWDRFAAENRGSAKPPPEKAESLTELMLKRNYGDAMLNRMLAQGVEFLPPPAPRDTSTALGQVRKAAVAVGDTWKVTRRVVGARLQPIEVEYACKLAAVKEGDALVSVAWKFEQKEAENAGEKGARSACLAETGSAELTFHAPSGMLLEMRRSSSRIETVQGGIAPETATKAVETRSFVLRPKEM